MTVRSSLISISALPLARRPDLAPSSHTPAACGRRRLVQVASELTPALPPSPCPPQEQLKEEVLLMARRVAASNLQMLLIDTENKFVSTGFAEEIAKAAGAKYYYLPNASDKSIAAATTSAMNEAKIAA